MDNSSALAVVVKARDEASATLKKIQRELANTSQSVKSVGDNSESLSRVNGTFDGIGAAVSRFGLIAGAATAAAGVASVKMAGDFQQSLNILGSVTGATAGEMSKLSETARQLGKDASLPGISAKDAAAAMTELGKAGLSVNDIMGASKGVLSLAKAGQIDVGLAATTTARALNAFGLQGSEASRIADLLSAGANSSTASVQDMALGLQMAGASSKSMGVSLQDTITALSIFSNAGINGSDAGTSLKSMFIQLANPTAEASGLMKQLGLDFFDAKGNFIGLQQTAGMLQKSLGGLSQEQRNQALATIFGSDASRVASILASTGADKFGDMAKAVTKSGAATDLAAAQNSGFNGALDNLISTLETVGTDLGTKVLPPLTSLIKTLANGVQPAVDWAIKNFPVLAGVITGVAVAVGAFKVLAFAAALKQVGFAATSMGIAFNFVMANPIILVLAALAGTLVYLQLKFDIFGKAVDFVRGVLDGINPALDTAKQFLSGLASEGLDIAKAAIDRFNSALDAGKKFVTDHMTEIKIAAGVLATLFGPSLLMVATQAVVAGAQIAGAGVMAAASWVAQAGRAALAWVVNLPRVVASAVATAISTAAQAVVAGFAWVLQAGRAAGAWLIQFGIMKVQAVIAGATMVAQAALAGYAWIARGVMVAIPWLIAFGVMIAGAIGAGISIAAAGIAAAIPWLIAFAPVIAIIAAVAAAAWLIVSNWGVITQFMSNLWNGVLNIVNGFIGWIRGNWPMLLGIITGPIGLAVIYVIRHWDSIRNGAANMIGGLVGFFQGLPGRIAGAVGNLGSLLYNSGRDLINGLIRGITDMAGNVAGAIGNVANSAKDKFKSVLGIRSPSTVFAGFGKNIIQGLGRGIAGSASIISSAMGSVSSAVSSGLSVVASPTISANVDRNDNIQTTNSGSSFVAAPSSDAPAMAQASGPQVVVHLTVGNVIGNESGLRELSVTMAKMVQDALQGQGTTDINMLRTP